MSFGLKVINSYGSFQIDGNLSPIALVQTGTGAATTLTNNKLHTSSQNTITYGRAYSNPIIFIRSGIGNEFAIVSQTSTSLTYMARGAIDYRVYEGAPIVGGGTGFSLHVRNSSGELIFDGNKWYPLLNQITQCWAPSPFFGETAIGQKTLETGWTSYSFSMTATDGGLPFVSGQTFMPTVFINGPSGSAIDCLECKFTATNQLQVASRNITAIGSFSYPGQYGHVGQTVRNFFLTR